MAAPTGGKPIGFFTYIDVNDSQKGKLNDASLGKKAESYFHYSSIALLGKKATVESVNPEEAQKVKDVFVKVEAEKPQKGWQNRLTDFVKIISLFTGVVPLVMLAAKWHFRSVNNFQQADPANTVSKNRGLETPALSSDKKKSALAESDKTAPPRRSVPALVGGDETRFINFLNKKIKDKVPGEVEIIAVKEITTTDRGKYKSFDRVTLFAVDQDGPVEYTLERKTIAGGFGGDQWVLKAESKEIPIYVSNDDKESFIGIKESLVKINADMNEIQS